MKTLLLVTSSLFSLFLFSLFPVQALSADWQRYHADPQQGIELFVDLDSLRQTATTFDTDVRLSAGQGKQTFQGRLSVDCQANTHRLSTLYQPGLEKENDTTPPDEFLPIGSNTTLSELKELYCARWQEPPGVIWKRLATSPGVSYFYDQRIERQRGKSGFKDQFTVLVKSSGSEISLLAKMQLSCRENSFAVLSGTHRDEARGWLANIDPGPFRPAAPDSFMARLMLKFCAPMARPDHR